MSKRTVNIRGTRYLVSEHHNRAEVFRRVGGRWSSGIVTRQERAEVLNPDRCICHDHPERVKGKVMCGPRGYVGTFCDPDCPRC